MHDPFARLNLEQIQAAAKIYRAQHPLLWWVAEFVVFMQGPRKSVRIGPWEGCGPPSLNVLEK